MLALIRVKFICTDQRHGTIVLDFGGPGLELTVFETVYEDSAGVVGQVELHPIPAVVVSGLEFRNGSGEPVI